MSYRDSKYLLFLQKGNKKPLLPITPLEWTQMRCYRILCQFQYIFALIRFSVLWFFNHLAKQAEPRRKVYLDTMESHRHRRMLSTSGSAARTVTSAASLLSSKKVSQRIWRRLNHFAMHLLSNRLFCNSRWHFSVHKKAKLVELWFPPNKPIQLDKRRWECFKGRWNSIFFPFIFKLEAFNILRNL